MNLNIILAVITLPICVFAGPASQPQLPFRPLNLQEALGIAKKENKPVLVYFSASWCMPCQWMEKNTFTDPKLAAYLQERFIGVKVDFDDAQGQAIAAKYLVNKLPTILIFNSLRQLIGTHQEMMEPERLLDILKRYSPNSTPVVGGLSAPRAQTGHLNRPALVTSEPNSTPEENTINGGASRNAANPVNSRTNTPGAYTPGVAPKKYGIQIGAFGAIENADAVKTDLETRYRLPVVIIQDSAPGRASFFKVVIGAFKMEEEALQLLDRLQRDGRQGYIREY